MKKLIYVLTVASLFAGIKNDSMDVHLEIRNVNLNNPSCYAYGYIVNSTLSQNYDSLYTTEESCEAAARCSDTLYTTEESCEANRHFWNGNWYTGTLDVYLTTDISETIHSSFSLTGINHQNNGQSISTDGAGDYYKTIHFNNYNGERICFMSEPSEHLPLIEDLNCLGCESGDVNEDGVVNILDVALLGNCIINGNCENYVNTDFNGDSWENMGDLVDLSNYIFYWGNGEIKVISIDNDANLLNTTIGSCYPCNENYHLVDGECLKIGCAYSNACNYDSSAMYDDGNCIFAEQNYDCDGNCLIAEDVDENGMCDGQLTIEGNNISEDYSISSIYPNPFNPTTTISFSIPELGLTTITSHDINGRKLETLTNENLSIGNYSIDWNASSYPSGVYLIRMDSGDFTQTQKVVLVK